MSNEPFFYQLADLLGVTASYAVSPLLIIAVFVACVAGKFKPYVPALIAIPFGMLNALLSQQGGGFQFGLAIEILGCLIASYIIFALFFALNRIRGAYVGRRAVRPKG